MFEYKIIKKIGVAGENRNDTKEINIIKWSDNEPFRDLEYVYVAGKNAIAIPLPFDPDGVESWQLYN